MFYIKTDMLTDTLFNSSHCLDGMISCFQSKRKKLSNTRSSRDVFGFDKYNDDYFLYFVCLLTVSDQAFLFLKKRPADRENLDHLLLCP